MCSACSWERLNDQIDEMLEDDRFEWASDTLMSIQDTVTTKEHASPRQWEAITNIEAAGARER